VEVPRTDNHVGVWDFLGLDTEVVVWGHPFSARGSIARRHQNWKLGKKAAQTLRAAVQWLEDESKDLKVAADDAKTARERAITAAREVASVVRQRRAHQEDAAVAEEDESDGDEVIGVSRDGVSDIESDSDVELEMAIDGE
jgi:hypothetical protein